MRKLILTSFKWKTGDLEFTEDRLVVIDTPKGSNKDLELATDAAMAWFKRVFIESTLISIIPRETIQADETGLNNAGLPTPITDSPEGDLQKAHSALESAYISLQKSYDNLEKMYLDSENENLILEKRLKTYQPNAKEAQGAAITNTEIIMKLIGPVRPVGDSGIDNDRYKNLKELCLLVDDLVSEISQVAKGIESTEHSVAVAGSYAYEFIQGLDEYIEA